MCLEDLVGYPWWDSAFGVGGSGRSPIESADPGWPGALGEGGGGEGFQELEDI